MANVLLIEDDDSQRFVAGFALKKAGHAVQEAHRQGLEPAVLRTSILRDVRVTDAEIAEARRLLRETKVADPQLQRRRAQLLDGTEAEQRTRIRELLLREKTARALQDFALALRQQAKIQILN